MQKYLWLLLLNSFFLSGCGVLWTQVTYKTVAQAPQIYSGAWVSGETTVTHAGVYGTLGVGSTSNLPGTRDAGVSWIDTSGNLWLFGGYASDSAGNFGFINDLWKYEPSTKEWTWVAGSNVIQQSGVYGSIGVGSTGNIPGARYMSTAWTDSSGNFWLFGGGGYDGTGASGLLNDLWSYQPSTGKWTWVSGANTADPSGVYGTQGVGSTSNYPGGRRVSISWADSSGNFWIFGGTAFDSGGNSGYLNDLWSYQVSSGKWTWVGGATVTDQTGTYGTQGVGSTSNIPSARDSAIRWYDSSGNLWLFGGYGFDSTSSLGVMNDFWKYQISTGKWTWVSGSDVVSQGGTFGTQGIGSTSNVPSARYIAMSWNDGQGNFWAFGGQGYDSTDATGYLNDLWKYQVSSGKWTWVAGSNIGNQSGIYGTLGTPAMGNGPGARHTAFTWMDDSGHLWLFGGLGFDIVNGYGYMNDLWRMAP